MTEHNDDRQTSRPGNKNAGAAEGRAVPPKEPKDATGDLTRD